MERRYKFWLETEGGERILWCPHGEHAGLHPTTYREARAD